MTHGKGNKCTLCVYMYGMYVRPPSPAEAFGESKDINYVHELVQIIFLWTTSNIQPPIPYIHHALRKAGWRWSAAAQSRPGTTGRPRAPA
jgi:hypothetical protein